MEKVEKPKVEYILGLNPSLTMEQKSKRECPKCHTYIKSLMSTHQEKALLKRN